MATRWQSSAKWTLVAVVGVVVLGGIAFWWFVLRGDAPERASLPVRTTDTTVAPAAGSTTGPDGDYSLSPGQDVFVGYRVEELFGGETVKKTAVGRTSALTGTLTVAGGQVTVVDIEADMTQLASDSSTRDNALRTRGLQTEQFPTATFVLTSPIELPADLAAGEQVELTATGDLTLHGVTRSVDVPLQALWDGASTISIATPAGIPILMADYAIEPPSNSLVTVDENGEIELQLVFVRS
ncbi:MAG: YceI family protein [Acidimicrobiales bacterium]|jgi:polyisoprenoid-binding protein YceI|nr:YceI family protein [Acidimicrobiales bacterium]